MARHHGPVLVDTNIIIESHRVRSWRALAGGYRLETVEECVAETQAGSQRRRPDQRIDEEELRKRLSLRPAYTRSWLDRTLVELVLIEGTP